MVRLEDENSNDYRFGNIFGLTTWSDYNLNKRQVHLMPIDITHLEIREDRTVAGKLQERLNAL